MNADTPRDKPERTPDTMSEAIAQGSPSGRMSKRARAAAQERLRVELFGKEGLAWPKAVQPTDEQRRAWRARDERERAARQAAKLEAQAGSPKPRRPAPGFYARLIEQHRPK